MACAVVTSTVVVNTIVHQPAPAFAEPEPTKERNELKTKNEAPAPKKLPSKEEEKEARRLAEETKKRLAVGRIGTI